MRRDESGIETRSQEVKTCKRHHTKLQGQICSVCEHRSEYMVHGNVDVFDQGFRDGYAGKPNTRSEQYARSKQHEAAANYEDGWKTGSATYRENHPAKSDKAPAKDAAVVPGKARYSLMPVADGSAVLLTCDGVPFAALLGADRMHDLNQDTACTIGHEVIATLNDAQSFGTRPSRLVRLDRGSRYQEECERNRAHIHATFDRNVKDCQPNYDFLANLVRQERWHEAAKIAGELYGNRQFVLGVIAGRGYMLPDTELEAFKREWEDLWDTKFGDLDGQALHMQD